MPLEELVFSADGNTVHLDAHDLVVELLVVVIIAQQVKEMHLVIGSGDRLVDFVVGVQLRMPVLDVHFALPGLPLLCLTHGHNCVLEHAQTLLEKLHKFLHGWFMGWALIIK